MSHTITYSQFLLRMKELDRACKYAWLDIHVARNTTINTSNLNQEKMTQKQRLNENDIATNAVIFNQDGTNIDAIVVVNTVNRNELFRNPNVMLEDHEENVSQFDRYERSQYYMDMNDPASKLKQDEKQRRENI